jgi:hypothetical protein
MNVGYLPAPPVQIEDLSRPHFVIKAYPNALRSVDTRHLQHDVVNELSHRRRILSCAAPQTQPFRGSWTATISAGSAWKRDGIRLGETFAEAG